MPQRKSNTLGQLGENYACHFLQEKGYTVLDRNFHSRFGEIDIIAQENGALVFVEVKTRRNTKHGFPEDAVTDDKLEKIKMTGHIYKKKTNNKVKKLRIEVGSLLVNPDNTIARTRHIKVG